MWIIRKGLFSPVYLVLLISLSLVLYLLAWLPRYFSGRYYHYLSRVWCRIMICVLDVDLHYVADHKHPLPTHFILIANHPSALEDFGIPALFDIYPLAKIEVRDWYVLGRISDFAGTIFVHRENADSRKAAIQDLLEAIQQGKNPVIFPEGGCKGKDIYTEFKTGAFDISIQTGVPVLPVYLHYVDENTYVWRKETLVSKLWQIFKNRDNRVEYHVYDALDPHNFEDKYQFAEHTRQLFLQWQAQQRAQSKTGHSR